MKTNKNKTVKTVKKMPRGYKVVKGATKQPRGTVMISNGKSLFDKVHKNYDQKLLIVDKAAYEKAQRKAAKKPAPKKPAAKKKPTVTGKRTAKTELKLVGNSGQFISVTKKMPKGWRVDDGATTNPRGTKWVTNGESHFNGKRKSKLLITDEKLFKENIDKPNSRYKVAPQRKTVAAKKRNDKHVLRTLHDINKPSSINNISKDVARYNGRGNLNLVMSDGKWAQILPQKDGTYLVRSGSGEKYTRTATTAKKELITRFAKKGR